MKKITLTPKVKRTALFIGIFLVCGGVLAVVLANANASVKLSGETSSSASSTSSLDISVASINSDSVSGTGSAFDPAKESSRSEPLTVSSKPASQPPKPKVEGDSVNGKQPTNSALTDKNHKPHYTSQPTAKSKKTPSSGKSGCYDPIFGNSHGTGGEMTTASDMYEDGVKVGIMD